MTEVLDEVREAARTAAVATRAGPIVGYREAGLSIFKGVRYGAPPLGALRLAPPAPPKLWREPIAATELGAPAIQAGLAPGEKTGGRSAGDPPAPGQPGTSEDCLFLNVWTPGLDDARRPVMVWLHGGGFSNGSGGAAMYDGAALARRGDLVTVTVNHRLNVFGYLNLAALGGHPSSGQAGMLDIIAALAWVRDNIARFGGDPGNVTIFGESGGGAKVSMLQAMPPAAGLFHKAVIQSGPGLKAVEPEEATDAARQVLAALKIAPGDIATLAQVDAAALQAAAAGVKSNRPMGPFAPSIDGAALPRHPFEPDAPALSAKVPVMIGTNKDEATLFLFNHPKFGQWTEEDVGRHATAAAGDKGPALAAALKRLFPDYSPSHRVAAVRTVTTMWAGSVRLAERKAAQAASGGAPVFMYRLDFETPVAKGALKSPHALEIPFVFDNVEAARNFVGRGEAPQRLADQMAPAWIAFARTGDPNTPDLPHWPAYDTARRATMVFDLKSRVEDDPWAKVRAIVT